MKNLTIMRMLTLLIAVLAYANSFAQSSTPPSGFVQSGKNTAGVTTPLENVDTLVLGAKMDYWVMPSAGAIATTTWQWSVPTGSASITGVPTGQTATLSFGSKGTGSVNVKETTNACQDPTGTTINYEVVDLPAVGFSDATLTKTVGYCNFNVDQALNLTLTSATKGTDEVMHVFYTIKLGGTTVGSSSKTLKRSDTQVTIPITEFGTVPAAGGTYTITFTNVDDRLLVKALKNAANSALTGTITPATATYTIVVTPVPQTGPIYHLPNM